MDDGIVTTKIANNKSPQNGTKWSIHIWQSFEHMSKSFKMSICFMFSFYAMVGAMGAKEGCDHSMFASEMFMNHVAKTNNDHIVLRC